MNVDKPKASELVINWHITEACNYACRYCYAHWCKPRQRELLHNEAQVKALLTAIYEYFTKQGGLCALNPEADLTSIRLNIAGGEPLLYPEQVTSICQIAHELGMKVSLISNASRLNFELMSRLAPYLSLLGLSLDSANEQINQRIGRITNQGQLLNLNDTLLAVKYGQKINSSMSLKVNTVVNKANCQENMTALIDQFSPSRWKVLRMLPVLNSNLAISDCEFRSFIDRHSQHKRVMRIEGNDEMSESYLMIDPMGRFYQNNPKGTDQGYVYSTEILEAGINSALNEINFSINKFLKRYRGLVT